MMLLVLGLVAASATPSPRRANLKPDAPNDIETFAAIVSRLRQGDDYYRAFDEELRPRGYSTAHPFNWRTPLLLVTVASVPESIGIAGWLSLSIVLVGVTAILTFRIAQRNVLVVVTAVVMQLGFVLTLSPGAMMLMGEAWSGSLIGLSALSYAAGRASWAVPLASVALLVRELAAPYCLVCGVSALVNRRWREGLSWGAVAVVYAGYYYIHLTQVRAFIPSSNGMQSLAWVRLDGLTFLLATVKWHFWLHFVNHTIVVFVFLMICAGTMSSRTPRVVRLSSVAYAVFFTVAGLPFNQYWGLVAWPTWAIACGYGAPAVWRWALDVSRRPG
jgi:hypothetical protein